MQRIANDKLVIFVVSVEVVFVDDNGSILTDTCTFFLKLNSNFICIFRNVYSRSIIITIVIERQVFIFVFFYLVSELFITWIKLAWGFWLFRRSLLNIFSMILNIEIFHNNFKSVSQRCNNKVIFINNLAFRAVTSARKSDILLLLICFFFTNFWSCPCCLLILWVFSY